ncbi:hypothetical protein Agub_g8253, partial [Astrephomene gubernaculifera]
GKRSKGLGARMGALVQKWSAAQRQLEAEEEEQARKAAEAEDPGALERKRLAELERWKWEQQITGAASHNANFAPLGDWRSRFPKMATQQQDGGGSSSGTGGEAAAAEAGTSPAVAGEAATDPATAAAAAAAAAAQKAARKAEKEAKREKKDKSRDKTKDKVKDKQQPSAAAPASALPSSSSKHQAAAAAPAASGGGVLNSKTRPDLDALSAGLPAGWRAMWDKGSGDVYYGNLTTRVGACRLLRLLPCCIRVLLPVLLHAVIVQ